MVCDCGRESGWTGLYDTLGQKIMTGAIVHWTDGGDDLPLEERIRTRWDRIAVVKMKGIIPQFHVIDSPHPDCRPDGKHGVMKFSYGSFIYTDTENYLTVVAASEDEYRQKFANAGECMVWVLQERQKHDGKN